MAERHSSILMLVRALSKLPGRAVLLAIGFLSLAANAYAVPVTVEVDWPNWSSENQVIIRDSSNTVLATICDPSNCNTGSGNTSYFSGSGTYSYNFPAGTNYSIEMNDTYGDGWNGGASEVRVYANGILIFSDDGPADFTQTSNFDVPTGSGGGGSGGNGFCGLQTDKLNNWGTGNLSYSETDIGGSGLNMSVAVTGQTGQFDVIEGGAFNGVSGLDLRSNGFSAGGGVTFTHTYSTGVASVEFDIGHINASGGGGDKFTITAKNGLGNTIYPTFTPEGSSYTANSSTGVVNATGATANNLGVQFEDTDLITEITIEWDRCDTCSANYHGAAIGDMSACLPVDYSDAPTNGTSYGDAIHTIVSGVQLGINNDAEASPIANATASADGADDDGVTIPALTQGQNASISVNVAQASANSGYLQGWIDWNGDGDWDDTGEQIASDLQTSSGSISVPVTPPYSAVNNSFARFRWSTVSGLNSSAHATDGEVEDYAIAVTTATPPTGKPPQACPAGLGAVYATWAENNDFNGTGTFSPGTYDPAISNFTWAITGDLDSNSVDNAETFSGSNSFETIYGQADTESNLNPRVEGNSHSNGDPIESALTLTMTFASPTPPEGLGLAIIDIDSEQIQIRAKDENGVEVPSAIVAGWFVQVFDPNTGSGGTDVPQWDPAYPALIGPLAGRSTWQDNSRGDLGDDEAPGGWFQPDIPISELSLVMEPVDSTNGTHSMHVYLTSCFEQRDYSDAPTTGTTYGAADHAIIPNMSLGVAVTDENGPYNSAAANGDADDSATIPALTQGQAATIPVSVNHPADRDGYLQAWIDWNDDGDWDDAGEQVASDLQLVSGTSGTINVPVTPPSNAATTPTIARLRWSTQTGLPSSGSAYYGEVEDYALTVAAAPTGPAFPPGPGLGNSICNAQPATGVWDNSAIIWSNNGADPNAVVWNTGVFASATPASFSGLSAQIAGDDLNVDMSTIPASYDPNTYIQYQITTTNYTAFTAELIGAHIAHYANLDAGDNQESGAYRFAIAVDDDPAFGSPDVLLNDSQIDDGTSPNSDLTQGPNDLGSTGQWQSHWDASGTTVTLAPSTTYVMRVYLYAATAEGEDPVAPYAQIVMWDDFVIKSTTCAADLAGAKAVEVFDPADQGLYALPGNDVIYTISVSNSGTSAADSDSIKLIDLMPPHVEFWNGDIDFGGPDTYAGTDPVGFNQPAGTGMSLTYASDVRFGTGATPPDSYDDCTAVTPDNTYRPDLTFICFNPKGTLATGDPNPQIDLSFRARIK